MRNKVLIVGLLIVLFLTAAVAIVLALSMNNQAQKLSAENKTILANLDKEREISNKLHKSIGEYEQQLITGANEINAANTQIKTLEKIIDELEVDASKKAEEQEVALKTIDEQNVEIIDLSETHDEDVRKIASLQRENRKYVCDKTINMDYRNIIASSERLMDFYGELSWVDRVRHTYRDHIWSNTDTKIHSVRYLHTDGNVYVDHFIVFVNEFGRTEGTFWIGEQCWLDPPNR